MAVEEGPDKLTGDIGKAELKMGMLKGGMMARLVDTFCQVLKPSRNLIILDHTLGGVTGLGSSENIFKGICKGLFKNNRWLGREKHNNSLG
jgi:hypothetical protein